MQTLAAEAGDSLQVLRYERLSPLRPAARALTSFHKVQKGDAFVAFSRREVHALRAALEESTGMQCATVYGGLPPETRSLQATLFNDPTSGFDVLAASDAIGTGLNLNIRRIVFASMDKFGASQKPGQTPAGSKTRGGAGTGGPRAPPRPRRGGAQTARRGGRSR